ncbi:MAG: MaoC family dehydratase N-terminal domain-containing protein [Novosphingobium sp.]|nr:MaoC family dehydratase N-terminal domain-containing protein [Novosphingobium sp.]MCP5403697.1 MaoC family dehydratase N-terminal domain-containing protein [Novosphingobium sp.]
MLLDYELLMSRRDDGMRFGYSDREALLYNLSIGMGRDPYAPAERPFVFELPELQVVPTFASVLSPRATDLYEGAGIDWTRVVHGEQRITLHRPLPGSAELVGSRRVTEVVDKGADKGALIASAIEASLASGEPLFTCEMVIFARGNGGFGGPTESSSTPHVLPDREPDMVHVSPTRRDQALLYRLNGDRNPLHADPDFAKRAGFPEPILHGLCSYGIACRAVLASVCDYDPGRIRQFDVRFSAPVFPGDDIHTDIWVDGDTVSYRCRVAQRDAVVLNNGRCLLNG